MARAHQGAPDPAHRDVHEPDASQVHTTGAEPVTAVALMVAVVTTVLLVVFLSTGADGEAAADAADARVVGGPAAVGEQPTRTVVTDVTGAPEGDDVER